MTISGFWDLGSANYQPIVQVPYAWNFRGVLTKIKHSHTNKAGLEARRDATIYVDNCCGRGAFTCQWPVCGPGDRRVAARVAELRGFD